MPSLTNPYVRDRLACGNVEIFIRLKLLEQVAGGGFSLREAKMLRRGANRAKNAGGSKESYIESLTAAGWCCDRSDVKAVIDEVFDQS